MDISDVHNLRTVSFSPFDDTGVDLTVVGGTVYVLNYNGFIVFDVTNPERPTALCSMSMEQGGGLAVRNTYAFVAGSRRPLCHRCCRSSQLHSSWHPEPGWIINVNCSERQPCLHRPELVHKRPKHCGYHQSATASDHRLLGNALSSLRHCSRQCPRLPDQLRTQSDRCARSKPPTRGKPNGSAWVARQLGTCWAKGLRGCIIWRHACPP